MGNGQAVPSMEMDVRSACSLGCCAVLFRLNHPVTSPKGPRGSTDTKEALVTDLGDNSTSHPFTDLLCGVSTLLSLSILVTSVERPGSPQFGL